MEGTVHLGIDVGGTFTDAVLWSAGGAQVTAKVPSTDPPTEGVVDGIERVCARAEIDPARIDDFRHGTTLGTNALLERTGATTALITTEGFVDVLEIGRQDRPELYDLGAHRSPPLIPRRHRYGLDERQLPAEHPRADATERRPDPDAIDAIATDLAATDVQSVAVCLLHADLDANHERLVSERLRERLSVPVLASHAVSGEFREYERTATTAASAYLAPLFETYLDRLTAACERRSVPTPWVMQSNGGVVRPGQVPGRAGATVLSGPAAGVIGAIRHAAAVDSLADGGLITVDMGGTSTDVCLAPDGDPAWTTETVVGGVPMRFPAIDVHTIGAGGGSIAWIDDGGSLRVGPEATGADPGPACYGRGGEAPTLTDAAVELGLIGSSHQLGGAIDLEPTLARRALADLVEAGGFEGTTDAAAGIVRVATAAMARAVRRVTVERGHDPRGSALVAYGGAGPMLAAWLAERIDVSTVVLPASPGVLSAMGLVLADERHDVVSSHRHVVGEGDPDDLQRRLEALGERALGRCSDAGTVRLTHTLDMRYRGQSYELRVDASPPLASDRLRRRFHEAHERRRGYRLEHPIEVVACRVRATVPSDRSPEMAERDVGRCRGERAVHLPGIGLRTLPVYRTLEVDADTPAIVAWPTATAVVPPGWTVERVRPAVVIRHTEDP